MDGLLLGATDHWRRLLNNRVGVLLSRSTAAQHLLRVRLQMLLLVYFRELLLAKLLLAAHGVIMLVTVLLEL